MFFSPLIGFFSSSVITGVPRLTTYSTTFALRESACNYMYIHTVKSTQNPRKHPPKNPKPKTGGRPCEETLTHFFYKICCKEFFAIRNEPRPIMHVQYSEVRLYSPHLDVARSTLMLKTQAQVFPLRPLKQNLGAGMSRRSFRQMGRKGYPSSAGATRTREQSNFGLPVPRQ